MQDKGNCDLPFSFLFYVTFVGHLWHRRIRGNISLLWPLLTILPHTTIVDHFWQCGIRGTTLFKKLKLSHVTFVGHFWYHGIRGTTLFIEHKLSCMKNTWPFLQHGIENSATFVLSHEAFNAQPTCCDIRGTPFVFHQSYLAWSLPCLWTQHGTHRCTWTKQLLPCENDSSQPQLGTRSLIPTCGDDESSRNHNNESSWNPYTT